MCQRVDDATAGPGIGPFNGLVVFCRIQEESARVRSAPDTAGIQTVGLPACLNC
jgi:hypothetical protein